MKTGVSQRLWTIPCQGQNPVYRVGRRYFGPVGQLMFDNSIAANDPAQSIRNRAKHQSGATKQGTTGHGRSLLLRFGEFRALTADGLDLAVHILSGLLEAGVEKDKGEGRKPPLTSPANLEPAVVTAGLWDGTTCCFVRKDFDGVHAAGSSRRNTNRDFEWGSSASLSIPTKNRWLKVV